MQRFQAHLVSIKTSSSPRTSCTWSSNATTNESDIALDVEGVVVVDEACEARLEVGYVELGDVQLEDGVQPVNTDRS